jgi:hypothetical protein
MQVSLALGPGVTTVGVGAGGGTTTFSSLKEQAPINAQAKAAVKSPLSMDTSCFVPE